MRGNLAEWLDADAPYTPNPILPTAILRWRPLLEYVNHGL
jgi:hypothetical protein